MTISYRVQLFLIAAVGSFALLAPSSVLAQSPYTWGQTGGGPFSWNDDANWSGSGFPNAIGDVANMNVNLSANQVVNLNQAITVGSLTIGDNSGGQTATLNPNGGSLTFDVASGDASLTRSNTGTGAVTISSGITLNDNLAVSLASGAATSTMTLSGVIAGTSTGITKTSGTLTLALSGNNSYSGVTAINTGVIAISNNNALGATGSGNNTTIAATGNLTTGGHLQLSGGITSAENITITGATEASGFNGAIRNTSGNNTLSGNIVLSSLTNGVRLDTSAGNLVFSGNISQTGSSQGFSLAPASGSTITVNNPIANNGGVFQTLSSGATGTSGTTILSGVNGTGIGATNVAQNSTLQLGVTNALNTTANLNIAAFGGADQGTFNLNGFNQTVNGLNSSASGANRIVRNNHATNASILTVGNGGSAGAFNGTIVNGAAATLALVKTGAGNQTLSGINTYTGGTTVSGGSLTLGHATNTLADIGAINVNGGTLALGTNSDTVGAVTLTSGSITSSTGVLTGSSYAVESGSVSAILGGASVALTKTTGGTVTLTGVNTYTGATNVNAGTLVVNGNNSAATGAVTVASLGTLGGSGTIGGDTTIQNGGTLSPGTSPGTLTCINADLIFNDGGNLNWQIFDATGIAGTGYDTNNVTGTGILDLSALTGATDFNVNLWSLSSVGPDVNGNATNFNNLVNQTWTLVSTPTAILNFDPSEFTINVGAINGTNGFTNSTGGGTFSVALADSNTDLVLVYTAVPEPTTIAILGAGALVGLTVARRRKA